VRVVAKQVSETSDVCMKVTNKVTELIFAFSAMASRLFLLGLVLVFRFLSL
jgi:hypothetical protein